MVIISYFHSFNIIRISFALDQHADAFWMFTLNFHTRIRLFIVVTVNCLKEGDQSLKRLSQRCNSYFANYLVSIFVLSIIMLNYVHFQGVLFFEKALGFVVASCPQADVLSSPRVVRTCVYTPLLCKCFLKAVTSSAKGF